MAGPGRLGRARQPRKGEREGQEGETGELHAAEIPSYRAPSLGADCDRENRPGLARGLPGLDPGPQKPPHTGLFRGFCHARLSHPQLRPVAQGRRRPAGPAVRLGAPPPRSWRAGVPRSARPLRRHPMRDRAGFAGFRRGRPLPLGMGGDGDRPGGGPQRRHRQQGTAAPATSRSGSRRSRSSPWPPNCRCRCSAISTIPRRPGSNTASSISARAAAPEHHAAQPTSSRRSVDG